MKYVRICAGADGESRFADETWQMLKGEFTPPSPAGYTVTGPMLANRVLMMHHPAGYRDEWHRAPAPVLGTVLRGTVRILTSDGDARTLMPGEQFLATDLTGTGHKMEEASAEAYALALVVLDKIPETLGWSP